MVRDKTKSGVDRQGLEEFRNLQEEMLHLSREYSQARLAVWAEEARGLAGTWSGMARDWQDSMEQMSTLAGDKFAEIAALGEASSRRVAQSWQQGLADLAGEVDAWGTHFLETLQKVAMAWMGAFSGSGAAAGGCPSFLGTALEFGGWFHQGGIVEAHGGMAVSPETLMADEQLVLAQAGEGILPRDSMARLGERNFEALRTGRFDTISGGAAPRYEIAIHVQTLDVAGVAGLDWDRLVQRHLLPALHREAGQRW